MIIRMLKIAMLSPLLVAAESRYINVPSGSLASVLSYPDVPGSQAIEAFAMMSTPVSNQQFLDFVRRNPQWRRSQVATVFAEPEHYLKFWQDDVVLGSGARAEQAVVYVSWFAASAFCEAQNARLPSWSEWEYVAAADATRSDARDDPAWREQILGWYARPSNSAMPDVGQSTANVYGIRDVHGLIWEWTQDYAAMLVSSDNRSQGDPNKLEFCGAGALSLQDRENYAVLMRIAMLSSLAADNGTANLGFRCVRELPNKEP